MRIFLQKIGFAFCFVSFIYSVNAQIIPKQDGDKYSLEVGNLYFEVDANFGARITSFKIDGDEFLTTSAPADVSTFWGSTLWLIPEGDHDKDSDFDRAAYTATIENSVMRFVSKIDEDRSGNSLQVIKEFSANSYDTSLSIKYSLVNKSGDTFKKALWPVTRTVADGLTFWPEGDIDVFGNLAGETENVSAYTWMLQDQTGSDFKKFKADGAEGWYAHATSNQMLFIKTFEDVLPADFADNEGEIEYWVHRDFAYIELENQSAFVDIDNGDTLHYEVKWYLRTLPESLKLEVGNMDLVDYAKNIVDNSGQEPSANISDVSFASARIYPNPASTSIIFNLKNASWQKYTLQLYSMAGSLIKTETISSYHKLDLSDLSKGVYQYSIHSGDELMVGKFIKL